MKTSVKHIVLVVCLSMPLQLIGQAEFSRAQSVILSAFSYNLNFHDLDPEGSEEENEKLLYWKYICYKEDYDAIKNPNGYYYAETYKRYESKVYHIYIEDIVSSELDRIYDVTGKISIRCECTGYWKKPTKDSYNGDLYFEAEEVGKDDSTISFNFKGQIKRILDEFRVVNLHFIDKDSEVVNVVE